MASAYLYVDRPVASLQCDVETVGDAITMIDPSLNKMLNTGRLPNGKLRIVIFGLGQETFSGKFASVNSYCESISDVVGANPDASNAGVDVKWLNSPTGLKVVLM
jgi:hypothetical protein